MKIPPGASAEYWFYIGTVNDKQWLKSSLPVDLFYFKANDPKFYFASGASMIEDKSFLVQKNIAPFIYGKKASKFIIDHDKITQVLIKSNFVLIEYENNTISIIDCKFGIKKAQPVEDDTAACHFVFSNIKLPVGTVDILSFLILKRNTGEYDAVLAVKLNSRSVKLLTISTAHFILIE